MIKTTAFIAFAGLALAIATTAASAQGLTAHAPPSDKTTQGSIIDPNYRNAAGGVIDPNYRKPAGHQIVPNAEGNRRRHKAGWDLVPARKL